MGKYKEQLEALYNEAKLSPWVPPNNKFEFIGDEIFEFTTYDGGMIKDFTVNMIEVINCILIGKTFEYQGLSDEAYRNYLIMINMPFMEGKLDWGTSIRGAWFDEYGYGNDKDKPYLIGGIDVPKIEIKEFMQDLLEWSAT